MKRTIPIVPLLLFISTALGADLHVPTPNYPTIQAAIDDAICILFGGSGDEKCSFWFATGLFPVLKVKERQFI